MIALCTWWSTRRSPSNHWHWQGLASTDTGWRAKRLHPPPPIVCYIDPKITLSTTPFCILTSEKDRPWRRIKRWWEWQTALNDVLVNHQRNLSALAMTSLPVLGTHFICHTVICGMWVLTYYAHNGQMGNTELSATQLNSLTPISSVNFKDQRQHPFLGASRGLLLYRVVTFQGTWFHE